MKHIVKVEKRHAEGAEQDACDKCYIARAIEESFGRTCCVTEDAIIIPDGWGDELQFKPDLRLVARIHAYDNRGEVGEFTIELDDETGMAREVVDAPAPIEAKATQLGML